MDISCTHPKVKQPIISYDFSFPVWVFSKSFSDYAGDFIIGVFTSPKEAWNVALEKYPHLCWNEQQIYTDFGFCLYWKTGDTYKICKRNLNEVYPESEF